MSRRTFTVGEAERLIPVLERIFFDLLQIRIGLRAQQEKLEGEGVVISGEAMERDDRDDSLAVRHAKGLFRAYYEALGDKLSEIARLGGEVKDIELGLVDFPGKRGGDSILLCWKLGERTITHWHSVEGGFASRKPIDDEVPGPDAGPDAPPDAGSSPK